MLNHRILLVTAAAATITPPPTVRAPEPLTFWAAGRASIVLAQAVANGTLEAIDPSVAFKTWPTPDEMAPESAPAQ